MSTAEKIAQASTSKSFHKLNPHLFTQPLSNTEQMIDAKFLNHPLRQKKRIRQSDKPLMNKLEQEYLAHVSSFARYLPSPKAQALKLRLANGVFYKPDLFSFAWLDGRPTAWEVKELRGKNVDRGKLALKVAASTWPEIRFIFAWRENGKWVEQEVLP